MRSMYSGTDFHGVDPRAKQHAFLETHESANAQ
jgi:hypothetical protein